MSTYSSISPKWLRVVPTLLVVGVISIIQFSSAFDALDRRYADVLSRLGAKDEIDLAKGLPDVAVVTIDPRSLRAYDDWPWPRTRHAEAVQRLTRAGVSAIAFDIDFSSPSTPENDALFAQSLRANDRSVLATFSQTEALASGVELEVVNRPVAALAEAAKAFGSVLVPIDADGVIRHAPRTSPIGGEAIPSLARAALEIVAPQHLLPTVVAGHSAGTTLIDYRRAQPTIPTVSYVDLMNDEFEPSMLVNRVVFIGATAAEFQDLWATPIERALPGVFIQALTYRTAAAEVVGLPILHRAPIGIVFAIHLLLALALHPYAGLRSNRLRRLGRFTIASGLIAGLSWLAYWKLGLLMPVCGALLLIAMQYMLGIESLQKRIQDRSAAQESSLVALARLGDQSAVAGDGRERNAGSNTYGLELALELLGEIVHARGVVLIRATARGRLTREILEWRPHSAPDVALPIDFELAEEALEQGRTLESKDFERDKAPILYSPLIASAERVGVLVVFCDGSQKVDALARRTIATVGAQMALTAQNLQLIEKLRETFESSIAAVAGAVEARDGYTDQHCRRLAAFASLMGTRLGMPEKDIRAMELGALLHDVGKIGIPDAILNKNGSLSSEERREMERHPEIGAGIVAPVVGLEETTLHCVIHHHERWDGAGYPEGLAGDEIPLAARIVSIVDVWDALSTKRPYKKAFSQAEVRDILVKGRGTHFDPDLVDLFFEVLHEQGDEMLELIARSSGTGTVA